jgi:large subunit ribosomal protein L4
VFGPQPRSYDYTLPKKVERGALRAALTARLHEGVVTVVDDLRTDEIKTKPTAALLRRLGATGRTLVIDVKPDEKFSLSARNVAGVTIVPSGKLTARDVMNSSRIIATRAAVERLQEVLG